MDLWHWKDPLLQVMQKVLADEEKRQSYVAVYRLQERRVVQLGSPEVRDVKLPDSGTVALGFSDVPYRQLISWDGIYEDGFLLNLVDGTKRRVIEKARREPCSPRAASTRFTSAMPITRGTRYASAMAGMSV